MKLRISFDYAVGSTVPFGAISEIRGKNISEWSSESFDDAAQILINKIKKDRNVSIPPAKEVEI